MMGLGGLQKLFRLLDQTRWSCDGVPLGALLLALLMVAFAARAQPNEGAVPIARPADQVGDARRLLEQGRQMRRAGDPYAALAAIAQAHRLQPGDPEIALALADILMDLGAPTAAADALGDRADIGVRSRLAGQRLRWAIEVPSRSPDPSRRFDDVDPALTAVDALLSEARAATAPDRGLLLRLQRDRAVALRSRERWQDAIDQVDALRAQGDAPPPIYVQQAEADARLALRQPAAARALYDDALARLTPAERAAAPDTVRSLLKGRFYAEVEAEDFKAAFATVDTLAAAEPQVFRQDAAQQTPFANSDWLDAQVLGAQARSYADMPADAWARIAPLSQGAPSLAWLRTAAAEIEAQRGWPRRAEADIEVAHSLAPDDFGIRLTQVESDQRRHRLARAEQRLTPLLGPGSGMPAVERVQRELDTEMGPSVRFETRGSNENGDAIRAPGSGFDTALRVETGVFDGAWRLAGFLDRNDVDTQGVRITRNRGGGGVSARWPDVSVKAEAWSQTGSLNTSGGAVSGLWEPDDHWALLGAAEYHSPDAPMRADFVGVTANLVRVGARHTWHESASAELGAQAMDFSDGNQRRDLVLAGALKVIDQPHLDVTLRPRLGWQTNTRFDTFYFSPARALQASIAAEVQHVVWRSYERLFVQRAMLTVGTYDQRTFGSMPVGSVLYEHSWRRDPNTELVYGVGWNSNVYDGQRETSWQAYLTFLHRFGR